jgi:hypothetical protein
MTAISTKALPQENLEVAKEAPQRNRVLILGGGFAGVAAARALKRADVEITLIDRRNHHIFQPLLYQVATAVLAPAEIATPIRQLEAKQKNLSVLLAEVKGINLGARTVDVDCPGIGPRKIEYDFLVIAAGMRPSYFGHDEFARFAPGLKNLNDAETIRTKILSAFELAESINDPRAGGCGGDRRRACCFDRPVGLGNFAQELSQYRSRQEQHHFARRRQPGPSDLRGIIVKKGCQAAWEARRRSPNWSESRKNR